ncbi:MAG: hypothetical protein H7Y88_06525 [Phycisphaerales bacterium]|nr:hypothetical protein [Phycisphaerales bacterium]
MHSGRLLLVLGVVAAMAGVGAGAGCSDSRGIKDAVGAEPIARGEAPGYAETAAKYNQRVQRLDRLFARTIIRIDYEDPAAGGGASGEARHEQGDGTLQIIRPDRVALSLNKAGKRLFWFGADASRFWWFDLIDERVGMVAPHERYRQIMKSEVGLGEGGGGGVHPLDLVLLLGVVPLPSTGQTQWSSDGRLLGLTAAAREGGLQRVWVNPETFEPVKVELYEAGEQGDSPSRVQLVVVADLAGYEYVQIRGIGGGGPRVATRAAVSHTKTGTDLRLDLSEMEDGFGRMDERAFDFGALVKELAVERVIER